MSDDPQKKRPQDAGRINMNEPYEVEYWTKTFNVSKAELLQAVEKVGTSADEVKKFLEEERKRTVTVLKIGVEI